MGDLLLKFDLLDNISKIEVLDYLEYLLHKNKKVNKLSTYKKQILKVSVWTEEDINYLKDNLKQLNKWPETKW